MIIFSVLLASMLCAPASEGLSVSVHSPVGLAFAVTSEAAVVAAPQQDPRRKPVPPPSGGTPEPTVLLLMAGGALGYGALRLSRRRSSESTEK